MGYIGSGPTRFNTADELTVTGDAEFNGNLTVKGTTTTIDSASVQTVDLGDNDKIRLGDGDDLQIYHDGSHSRIAEVGNGRLTIETNGDSIRLTKGATENMLIATPDGSVDLYYDNAAKLATTATGVDVTGTVTADGLTVSPSSGAAIGTVKAIAGQSAYVSIMGNNTTFLTDSFDINQLSNGTAEVIQRANYPLIIGTNNTERMRIDSSGNVGIGTSPSQKLSILTSNGLLNIANGNTSNGTKIQSFTTAGNANGYLAIEGFDKEYIRIDSSGNVGIGTSSPTQALVVSESSTPTIQIKDGAASGTRVSGRLHIGESDTLGVSIENSTNSFNDNCAMVFKTSPPAGTITERMRIDTSGNLLVGTTSASTPFDGCRIAIDANSSDGIRVRSSGVPMRFIATGTSTFVGSISTTASATSYNTSSDYRLKTAVNYDWDATTRLKQLRPARFEWIADGDDAVPVDGFLAHEVQDVVPEAITGTHNGMRDEEYQVSAATGDIYTPAIDAVLDEDGNEVTPAVAEVIHSTDVERPEELAEGQQWRETTAAVMGTRSVPDYQGIDQSKLVPLLVKTIQELEARITALETA